MEKRYVCFVCHSFHPETRGISEAEFNAGKKTCTQEKCTQRGEMLEPAIYCDKCNKLFPFESDHGHDSDGKRAKR